MSEELKTDAVQSENEQENETLNDEIKTDENITDTQTDDGDVEKQELSVYEKELAELKKREEESKNQVEKLKDIVDKKNRALEAEKKKNKPDFSEVEKLREELDKLRADIMGGELNKSISAITNDQAERELILRHYNTSIVKTGNLEEDLQNALAIANRSIVMEQKRNKALEEGNENFLASFAKNGSIKGNAPAVSSDPIQRETEALVRSINPNAVKYVKEQFKT